VFRDFFLAIPDLVDNKTLTPTKRLKDLEAMDDETDDDDEMPLPLLKLTRSPTVRLYEDVKSESNKGLDMETEFSVAAEIHNLFRVMTSGRWAVVTPAKLIKAIWRNVPGFRSYKQQDAQEFLAFFLERLEKELVSKKGDGVTAVSKRLLPAPSSFIKDSFECSLVTETTCLKCKKVTKFHQICPLT
jgi:hypothetical protein